MPSSLDVAISLLRGAVDGQLGRSCGVGSGVENVSDLGRSGERVQVCGAGGVTCGVCRVLRRPVAGILRGSVRIYGGDALQFRPTCTVDERPRRVDSCAWSAIVRVLLLEEGEDFLGALDSVASDDTQLLHGQLDVVRPGRRHGPEYGDPANEGRRFCCEAVSERSRRHHRS